MDIERHLRDSLAPRPAPPDLEAAVMARLRESSAVQGTPPQRRFDWRLPAAFAATVLSVAGGLHWYAGQQRAAHDRQQLMLALAITSSQLNQVQQRLTRPESIRTQENGT